MRYLIYMPRFMNCSGKCPIAHSCSSLTIALKYKTLTGTGRGSRELGRNSRMKKEDKELGEEGRGKMNERT